MNQKKEPKKKNKETLTPSEAQEVIGEDSFFGKEAVYKTFGIELEDESIPDIPFSREDLERAKYVVDWHTHHVGFGEMSEGDAGHINCAIENFGQDKPIYFIVFRPVTNQSVWYQAKRV